MITLTAKPIAITAPDGSVAEVIAAGATLQELDRLIGDALARIEAERIDSEFMAGMIDAGEISFKEQMRFEGPLDESGNSIAPAELDTPIIVRNRKGRPCPHNPSGFPPTWPRR